MNDRRLNLNMKRFICYGKKKASDKAEEIDYSKKKHSFFVDIARRAAECSTHCHRHGCVIYVPSLRCIFTGFNHETATTKGYLGTIHAEMDACKSVPRKHLRGSIMYVVRITSSGSRTTYSPPCTECAKRIVKFGISRVFYSTH